MIASINTLSKKPSLKIFCIDCNKMGITSLGNAFEDLGKFDVNMPFQGYEDWEFWLRFGISGKNFLYLPQVTFDYRVTGTSMIRSFTEEMSAQCTNYTANKHAISYARQFKLLNKENADLQESHTSLNKRMQKVTDNLFYKAFKKVMG